MCHSRKTFAFGDRSGRLDCRRQGEQGSKRSEVNEMRGTERCCGEETQTTSTEISKPGKFISFSGPSSAARKRHSGGIRAARQCRKNCVVKQTMLWCLKDWAVETGKRFDSPLSSHSLSPSEQWAGEKSKSRLSRSVPLRSPSCSSFPRLQCPELYLARTKPLCHLFKGLFFLFLSLFLCSRAWHSILSSPPPPPYFISSCIQRKNGLFKKAYELGVLCSVEVAVIIFGRLFSNFYPDDPDSIFIVAEERPGHHVKLYQYGSADVHDIVQRHLRVSRLHFLFLSALAKAPIISTMARRTLVVQMTSRVMRIQS